MNTRVRVLPPVSRKGLYAFGAATGLLQGMFGSWLWWLFWDLQGGLLNPLLQWVFTLVGFLTIAALYLAPAALLASLVARIHQHLGRFMIWATCFGYASVIGIFVTIPLHNPESLLSPWTGSSPTEVFATAILLIISSAVFGTAMTGFLSIVFALERSLGRRVVRQSGLVCWTCGYDLGSERLSVCPECSRAFDPRTPPRMPAVVILGALTRNVRLLILLAGLLAIVPLIIVAITRTAPSVRFLTACVPPAERRVLVVSTCLIRERGPLRGSAIVVPVSTGWWIPDAGSPTTGFAVQFFPSARGQEPSIVVSRACRTAPIPGVALNDYVVTSGSVLVTARLPSAQAAEVISRCEVPAALLRTIRERADQVGWAELPIGGMPTGPEVAVDPSSFFGSQAEPAPHAEKNEP